MAELLDLDADVLHEHHRELIAWAGSLVAQDSPVRIIDLGAGSGTGTLALARHLPRAEVIAVDMDEHMLDHLRHRATEAGLADRVRTLRVDLDAAQWPEDLGPAELVWASASMHHLADPDRTLAQVRGLLRPGGSFMITELDSFPRFLADPADAALEERCHTELDQFRRNAGMHMGLDWGARLKAAGFELVAERHFDIALQSPLPANARRYAELAIGRMRERLAERLGAEDLNALDALFATVKDRHDLVVRTTRTVWIGRRP